MKSNHLYLLFIFLFFFSCNGSELQESNDETNLTIFFINDQHGKLDNFAKIKVIIDEERENNNVIVACSGDIFSGNPVVDNHPQKGFPMIDLMNRIGFDISVIGNHEFDYGQDILKARMEQAEFDWICANVNASNSVLPEPAPYKTLTIDGLKITFLGLVETYGKPGAIIPSTHPWRVKNLEFTKPEVEVANYSDLKQQENADLLVALTHLGHDGGSKYFGDYKLAQQFPFFDLILGGHSHRKIDTKINNIPVFQTGYDLHNLGKVMLKIKGKEISSVQIDLIDLDTYQQYDEALKSVIDEYNNLPELKEIVGFSHRNHEIRQVGCFYVDALMGEMKVDVSFQNTGGVRAGIDEGDITKREIYEMDPFSNGSVIYSLTAREIKEFLVGSASGFYYSGIQISQNGNEIVITDKNGVIISDDKVLTVGINDYIPAVHEAFFPDNGDIQSSTTAETIIRYLQDVNEQVDYPDCDHYFRYQN